MSLIQDKLGNDFLRSNGAMMDANFAPGMIMYLPPVTSFTRLAAHSVMQDLPPQEVILKKERDSPDCGMGGAMGGAMGCGVGDYVHAMGIKQEKLTEHDYRLPLYPGGGGKSAEMLEVSLGNHQSLLVHDLSMGNLPGRSGKESAGRRGRRSNGDGSEGKPRRKRGEAKQSMMLDADGSSLSPGTKPHICEHCNASFRSSYHLRRHVLIHTGERPYRCSQCNMSFIQKYLLQRHEKIHSGEKPFCCDQCNMRFIQKYHMERHKRTHSGEKPYRCETCQQYFSRTDRLLKHKRTCGEAIKKGLEPGMLDLGCADMAHGSYAITQGNAGARKRGRSKHSGEAGEQRKRKKGAAAAMAAAETGAASLVHGGYALHDYSAENHIVSSSSSSSAQPGPSMHQGHQGRAPKMAFKKANRKGLDKGVLGQVKQDQGSGGGLDGLGLLQPAGPKTGPVSSNYDDAMQFLKKRRYLHAANNVTASSTGVGNDYDVAGGHQSVIQGVVTGAMDSETPLSLLDSSSPMGAGDNKHDKSGIPDEVLQSLLEHYTHKPDDGSHHHDDDDVPFDLQLHPPSVADDDADSPPSPSSGGDKTVIMHEYSRFLLQALERTSQTAGFPLGPSPPAGGGGPFAGGGHNNPLYADKNVYTASPLECGGGGYGQSGGHSPSSSSLTSSSVPKSHFALLSGASPPQHSFHLSLEHQQLTPSQELTDQIEKQQQQQHHHHPPSSSSSSPPSSYQISPSDLGGGGQKERSAAKNGVAVVYPLAPSQELASLDAAKSYQIENFAQAFGSQFKSVAGGGRGGTAMSYGGGDSNGEADHHRIRTPVSEFSGYTSLLVDVSEPVSTGSKTPTSQSYR